MLGNNEPRWYGRVVGHSEVIQFDGSSLALIGNARAGQVARAEAWIRGVFDKETRRKPLARWTRVYGIWMAAWSRIARPEGAVGLRKLAGNQG